MAKSKKFSILLFSLVLVLASFLFVACGKMDFSKTKLVPSSQYIELFVGQSKNVTITIENPAGGMSKLLQDPPYQTNDNVDVQQTSYIDYSTIYTITAGKDGGNTSITFTTMDGAIKTTIDVFVRKYSDVFEAKPQDLFLTENTAMIPSKDDFIFEADASERELEFYFYGLDKDKTLTIEDISGADGQLQNEFVKAELVNQGGKKYLIFTDANDNQFTIAKKAGEDHMLFASAAYNEGTNTYSFTSSVDGYDVAPVNPGDKFSFAAKYDKMSASEEGKQLLATKSFSVFNSIVDEKNVEASFEHSHTFKDDDKSDTDPATGKVFYDGVTGEPYASVDLGLDTDTVTFIPYYKPTRMVGLKEYTVDFLTAYVKIVQKGDNPLLNIKAYSEDSSLVTGTFISKTKVGNDYVYWYKLNNAQGNKATTNYVFHFYYTGFENSDNSEVSFKYKVPVETRNIPESLFINNLEYKRDAAPTATYTFYNHYEGNTGWIPFRFIVNPTDAEYDEFILNFANDDDTNDQLMVKYLNKIYTPVEGEDFTVTISDPTQTVYIKGVEGADALSDQTFSAEMKINFVGEDTIKFNLGFDIQPGATDIEVGSTKYEDPESHEEKEYSYTNGISIDLGKQTNAFHKKIWADQAFESFTAKLLPGSGDDIVKITNAGNSQESGKYYLNLNITPIKVGEATYVLTLDNGVNEQIKIKVVEALNSTFVETTNANNLIKIQSQKYNEYYLFNGNSFNGVEIKDSDKVIDFQVYSNGSKSAKAIESVEIVSTDWSVFSLYENNIVGDEFKLKLMKNGNLISKAADPAVVGSKDEGLVLKINGYEVTEDFRVIPTYKKEALTLHAYDFIDGIKTTFENEDGDAVEAQKVSVYTGISNTSIRQVTFDFEVAGSEKGFVFWNQSKKEPAYENTTFDKKYIYWEVVIDRKNYILSYPDSDALVQNWSFPEGDFSLDVASGKLSFIAKSQGTAQPSISLLTHIKQYGKTFTYTTKIEIKQYNPVQGVTTQSPLSEISMSALKREFGMLFIPLEGATRATNPRINAYFTPKTVNSEQTNYQDKTPLKDFFNSEDGTLRVVYDEGSRKTFIALSIKDDAQISALAGVEYEIAGTLTVFATDWYDTNGFAAEYLSSVLNINVRFENGTKENRFTLETAEDVKNMKNNLSSHYQLSTAIDISSLASAGQLPLGELTGSIVGKSDYAKFTGINLTKLAEGKTSISMFDAIGSDAYIKNIGFEGLFEIAQATSAHVAMVAQTNNGTLENISVLIKESRLNLKAGAYFGGVVAINNGIISQDFSQYDKYVRKADGSYEFDDDKQRVVRDEYNSIYDNCAPKTLVKFAEMLNITVDGSAEEYLGGVAASNYGTIKRVKSAYVEFVDYYGYSNYFAITQIAVVNNASNVYLGGVVGSNASGAKIIGSESIIRDRVVVSPEKTQLIVGGEVSAFHAGGVVGRAITGKLEYVTTRTFVRGNNIGLVGNISGDATATNIRVEAIDDGRFGYFSSMGVAKNNTHYPEKNAFYGFGTHIEELPTAISYLKRSFENSTDVSENLDNTKYYGDFIAINASGTVSINSRYLFSSADTTEMKISANFGNEMEFTSTDAAAVDPNLNVMYAYRFGVDSFAVDGLSGVDAWEDEFNQAFNTFNSQNSFYPFACASKEVSFISNNPDVLKISDNGTISIIGTGLVYVQAVSILNSASDGLGFYLYVTDYINTDENVSIIYPNTAKSSIAIDQTTIQLRGENIAMLYVRPNLEIKDEGYIGQGFTSDQFGLARYQGILFNMTQNSRVTIEVPVGQQVGGSDVDYLDISISGQTIYIQRDTTKNFNDCVINLSIQPMLECTVDDEYNYKAYVNKHIEELEIDYKKGAILIENERYNAVPIYSSKPVEEVLHIKSTANEEIAPYYQVVDEKGNIIQSTLGDASDANGLFIVTFKSQNPKDGDTKTSKFDTTQDYYSHMFDLEIRVNKQSEAFKGRYEENIYGDYTITFYANSNIIKSTSFDLLLRQTGIASIPIENYTKLSDAIGTLPTKSEVSYPGESGVLAITVSPVDADFDSVIIENADQNYSLGHAHAVFGLLTRRTDATDDENIFESTSIVGSQGARGLEIRFDEIVSVYSAEDREKYNGVFYIQYDFSSENVLNDSVSNIIVKFMKDGQSEPIAKSDKDLTIKLQQFVGIELVGKTKIPQGDEYYSAYAVARGLKYELQINSYGYKATNIKVTSDDTTLGEIIEENGKYYLQINSQSLLVGKTKFAISAEAQEEERSSSSKTLIDVKDFVINYFGDTENPKNPDVVTGMGNGIVNVQIGTQITFGIDLYNYIEYDTTNDEIAAIIANFHETLSKNAIWMAYTDLVSDDARDSQKEPNPNDTSLKKYQIGFANGSVKQTHKNYYFKSDGLNIIPVKTKSARENNYYFELKAGFIEQGTSYSYATNYEYASQKINVKFTFNVFVSSSEESPIPIQTYEQFMDMQAGAHYILLNDIVLSNETYVDSKGYEIAAFKPFEANFASLDGNGSTVHFEGKYDFGSAEELGLFSSIEKGTIVKNLNVNYRHTSANKIATFVTTAEAFHFGGLATTNSGVVTNCYVFSTMDEQGQLSTENNDIIIDATNAINGTSYIAGLVDSNNGSITNSSVRLNISSTFYISGVVSQNSGRIAATAFRGGKLLGNATNQRVSGFVYTNSEGGQIITSFVAGQNDKTNIYSKGAELTSTQPSAGFAYVNNGLIRDCYSDMAMEKCSARNAGFAYINGGTIRNSFSLSRVKSNNEGSAGFVMQNSNEELTGTIENCYYYYDATSVPQINVALAQVDSTYGIQRLDKNQFGQDFAQYFEEFSYTNSANARAVWFYSTGSSNMFKTRTMTFDVDYVVDKSVPVTKYAEKETNMSLPAGRLELVSANIYTLSRRTLDVDNQEEDPETGDIIYHYLDAQNAPNRGSINNPRLIATAKNMEDLISENTSATGFNKTNYRIIDDFDYNADVEEGGVEGYSTIHNTVFAGVMEGNGMTISNIGLASMDKLSSAGMFAQVGYAPNQTGSIKNLTIIPREVAFNSSSTVGTVAGVLSYGYLYDVSVLTSKQSSSEGEEGTESATHITVTGQNFVGGVVGRAIYSYEMKDVYSNLNASAGSTTANMTPYTDTSIDFENYSYAGSIAGFLGTGKVYNAHVSGVSAVMGGRSGFAYGGIGENGEAKYTFVDVARESEMRAYQYGGYIVGETAGTIKYVHVNGTGQCEATFIRLPKAAHAVGGVAGKMLGGTISGAVVDQEFQALEDSTGNIITNIGGIVGIIQKEGRENKLSYITDSVVYKNIASCATVGGAVGTVASSTYIDSVGVKSAEIKFIGEATNPSIGGLIGAVESTTTELSISNSYSTPKLTLNTHTSGVASIAKAGGFVGRMGDNVTLSMRACYTTSEIDATVYDDRVVGEPEKFVPDGSNTREMFQQKIVQNSKIVDVYYVGSNATGSGAYGYTPETEQYVKFNCKAKAVDIGLAVTQYGTSSIQYVANQMAGAVSGQQAFYGLFGAEYSVMVQPQFKYEPTLTEMTNGTKLRGVASDGTILEVEYNGSWSSTFDIDKEWIVTLLAGQVKCNGVLYKADEKRAYYVRQNLNGGFTAYDKLRDFLAGYREVDDFRLVDDSNIRTALVKNITADMLSYAEFENTAQEKVFDDGVTQVYRDVWYYINNSETYDDAKDHAWLVRDASGMYLKVGNKEANPTTIYKWFDNKFIKVDKVGSDATQQKKDDGSGALDILDLSTVTKEEFLHNGKKEGGVNYGKNLITMPELYEYKVNLNDKDLLQLTDTSKGNKAEEAGFAAEIRFSESAIMTYFKDSNNNIYRSKFNEAGEYIYENIATPSQFLYGDVTLTTSNLSKYVSTSVAEKLTDLKEKDGAMSINDERICFVEVNPFEVSSSMYSEIKSGAGGGFNVGSTSESFIYKGQYLVEYDSNQNKWFVTGYWQIDSADLEQVWYADTTGQSLTVLYFENHLEWLNKL